MNNSEKLDKNNKEFSYAEQLILYSNRSIYLTGKAGTGKSTFLRYIKQHTTKNVIVVAPTGIAAINVGGMTINSFFQLPFTPFVWDLFSDAQQEGFYNLSKEKREIIQKADLIIIDEISMVRADVVDAIDYRLRHFGGKKHLAFGGKQILFVGDSFQLEPIAQRDEWQILSKYYESPYFFSARVFKEINFINIELQTVYRQSDPKFVSLLNKVRVKQANAEDLHELNKNYIPDFTSVDNDGYITLATKRDIVDATNMKRLNQLEGTVFQYEGVVDGVFGRANSHNDDLLPTNKILDLKKGAQVMFVKNDRGGRWVNGTIGVIEELNAKTISVSISQKEEKVSYTIEKAVWENIKYELDKVTGKIVEKTIGTFTQYPVKLAWAITIHKSQGLTFDKIVIDMGAGAFSAGHTYVALSRCTSFEGIKLRTPIRPQDIIVRDEVIKLAQTANDETVINNELSDSRANYYYRECVQELGKNNFVEAYEAFIKAKGYRDDTSSILFKRLLSIKLHQLKAKNKDIDQLDTDKKKLSVEIEKLKTKLRAKDKQIKDSSTALLELQEEMETLYRTVDSKEREERFTAGQLQIAQKEIAELKEEKSRIVDQSETETQIRLEAANQTIIHLQEEKKNLSSEISNWKKYTLIAVAAVFIILILIVIKLIK